MDEARARLAQEEEYLTLLRAHDNAAVYFVVVNQLRSIMEPVFAMGPAWTVMRSMSAHLSEEKAEEETALLFGKEKTAAIEKLRRQRVEETQKLLEVLDLGSGNSDFEADLRSALLKVVMNWDQKRERLTADGRRPRAKKDVAATVHPKSRTDGTEVLEVLKKSS
ncbi:hypothetical protein M8312_13480 [Sphingomonas sp. KRR8]|uniref:hypothetical protein n=1 Tax=Sphingomonas sp. KRR8 TaxID=2942996 RepID=UPI002021240E|nr:hypothetical protein [Sphingomonas sp. KRR8]URD60769.1 hypothetical protein M8312_13480 [Sphingomonas sp. KRR8]